jgi:hypothetical protein
MADGESSFCFKRSKVTTMQHGSAHGWFLSTWTAIATVLRPGIEQWLPSPSAQMCFRAAVRAAEAWLLADRERMARWLAVSVRQMPENPDGLDDPKQEIINLARRSRRRAIKDELVPRQASGRTVGPLYTTRLIEFVQDETAGWRPDQALHVSNSLARCIQRLRHFPER